MADIGDGRVPSRGDLRKAARSVRASPLKREVLGSIRPRGVSGVFRSRLPLALQMRLAAQQNRLLWWSPEFFAILVPPATARLRTGSWWLRWLDRWWDLVLFLLPPLTLLAAGGTVAILWSRGETPGETWAWTAVSLALAAALYVTTLMLSLVIRGSRDLYRMIILGRSKEATETGIGQVLVSHWSIPLCHVPTPGHLPALLNAVRSFSPPAGASPVGDVLCFESGITSTEARAALRRQPRVDVFTKEPPVLIVRSGPTTPFDLPPEPANVTGSPLHGIPLLLGAMAVIILVLADGVAGWERAHCTHLPQPASCDEQPTTYGDALYWLLNRLSGGDPEGLGAQSFQARSMGLLTTLMSVIIVGWVITTLIQQAAARSRNFGQEVVDAYNKTLPTNPAQPTMPAQPVESAESGIRAPADPVERSAQAVARLSPRESGILLGLAAGVALGALLARRRR